MPSGDHGVDIKIFDLAKSVHWIVDESSCVGDSVGLKRRRMLPVNDDSDEETTAPPANDIYRLRQQKRFTK